MFLRAFTRPLPRVPQVLARRLLKSLAPYRGALCVYVVVLVVSALGTVSIPIFTRTLVNVGLGQHRPGTVILCGGLALAAGLVATGTSSVGGWLGSKIGLSIAYDLRMAIYRHLQSLPVSFFVTSRAGAVQSRISTDVIDAQSFVQTMFGILASNVIILLVAVAAMWKLSPLITVITLLPAPLLLIPARRRAAMIRQNARGQAAERAAMQGLLAERFNAHGATLFTLSAHPEADAGAFEAHAKGLRDVTIARNATFQTAAFYFGVLAVLAYGAIYLLGGWEGTHGRISIGTLIALSGLATVAYGPLQAFAQGGLNLGPGLVAFECVFEILDFEPAIRELAQPVQLRRPVQILEADDITFTYPAAEATLPSLTSPAHHRQAERSRPALEHLSFTAASGTLSAIIGPTGAGKTTITQLIPRLYDPRSGAIRLDGTDIRHLALTDLRSAVGLVSQDPVLLNDTLAANLRIARPDATDKELLTALEQAHLAALLDTLPAGLATTLGDRGHQLSGGEKQRVAIARALLADPDVLILDEATAHLDNETERAIQATIEKRAPKRSLL
jgi:ATP-binding cassette, subfamily B, bacterial